MPIPSLYPSTVQTLSPQSPPENSGKLASAAKDFESILLGQWLQGAETSFGSVPGAEDDQDNGDEQMKSFGVQQLAKALTDAGGIGIADMVSKALARPGNTPATIAEHAKSIVST